MMVSSRFPSRFLFAAATAVALAVLFAAPARAQSDKPEAVREVILKGLQAALELHKAQKYPEALDKLRELDAVPERTAFENYHIERQRGTSAIGAGDGPTAETAFEFVLASGRVPPAERIQVTENLVATFQKAKDHPKTVEWARRHVKEGGKNPQIRTAMIYALYQSGENAEAAREMQADIAAIEAAGKVPTEDQLKLLGSSQDRAKDPAGYLATLEKLVARYPNRNYWNDLLARVRRLPSFSQRHTLDVLRLKQATVGLIGAIDYTFMAELALEAGMASEAARVLEKGYSSGLLGVGANAQAHAALRERAAKEAAEDAKALAAPVKPWANAKNGIAHVNYGLVYVLDGKFDPGLAMIEEGLAKGGLKQPDDTRLHLGMGYVLAGQKDKALQALGAVQGADGASHLARLWKLHAQRPGA